MTLPLAAVAEAVPREWSRFRSLLSSADGATWSGPTRLAGWTVRDLAVHAVWGVSMEADALRRRRTAAAGRAEGRTVDEDDDPEEILAALDEARHDLTSEVAALAGEDLDSVVPLPYFDVPLGPFSQILVMEAGTHTDDLAAALGHSAGLAADVVVATEAYVRAFLTLGASTEELPASDVILALRGPSVDLTFVHRDGRWEVADPDGPARAGATVEADDSTVLLFALGRVPVTDPRLSFSGDRMLATRFKTWLPGP